ncbi:hypothetical protein DM860_007085 [Cuscuta australis]|uniref:Uncharacterized protein n=1 Tax=Cuscuta australis TaxID=267555 RepID=A0A328EA25_9ASTE|nr:hypothetical protein DM860_007085 [Cuscuta australis]
MENVINLNDQAAPDDKRKKGKIEDVLALDDQAARDGKEKKMMLLDNQGPRHNPSSPSCHPVLIDHQDILNLPLLSLVIRCCLIIKVNDILLLFLLLLAIQCCLIIKGQDIFHLPFPP